MIATVVSVIDIWSNLLNKNVTGEIYCDKN